MKIQTNITLIALACLALTACAGKVKPEDVRPDWVDGSSSRYPNSLYMTSRGQAPDLDTARDRARADLAKMFEVVIREDSRDSQRYERAVDEAGASVTRIENFIQRDIAIHTEQVIRGIEIADSWRDPETDIHYALAVLNRQKTIQGMRMEIEMLDNATGVYLGRARSSDDKLTQVAAAAQAIGAQRQRLKLHRLLHVLDRQSPGSAPRWDVARLETDFRGLLEQLRIRPNVTESPALHQAVSGALAAAGFLAEQGEDADYVLVARLKIQDIGKFEDWYWLRGNLIITLRDSSGRIRGTQLWPLKQSATQKATAEERIMRDVVKLLERELRLTLLGFAQE